jgi:hypothetical protein
VAGREDAGPRDLPDMLSAWPPALISGSRSSIRILLSECPRGYFAKHMPPCTVLAVHNDDVLAEMEVTSTEAHHIK